jgi:1-phosphofructokinase family hexose kinase
VITCLALSASLDVTYLVDELDVGGIHRPTTTLKLPGGKALNVARALVSLGEPVRAIAVLGGRTGQLIEDLLKGEGIETHIVRTSAETRSCVTIASTGDGRLTEVYEHASPIDESALRGVEQQLATLSANESPWLVVSGSVPAGTDLAALGRMLRERRDAGIRIALDTSGSALDVLIDFVRPHVVKINRFEASELAGAGPDADLEDLARGIRDRTGGLVIITDGARGSLALGDDGPVRTNSVPRVGNYAVGSGDCFLAGFVCSAAQGDPLERALAMAAACASANASVPGAAIFDDDDLP